MLVFLTIIAVVFFLTHVVLMLASFNGGVFSFRRYFLSHVTLWLTGLTVFCMVTFYHGTGVNSFLNYFDTSERRWMILVLTFALSAFAHLIVRLLVLPGFRKREVA